MTDVNIGGQGIEVLSHDEGSYLVQSRTNRDEHHMVELLYVWVEDPITGEKVRQYTGEVICTCPSFHFRKKCFHIPYVCKILGEQTPKPTNNQLIAA
jgi:hypothetical protein